MITKVLDHGWVELVDFMGSDRRILETARISTGAEPVKGDVKDRGLIRYLYRNKHMTPLEACTFTFRVKAPIFVARQWFRHRTSSFSEISARYTTPPEEYYTPTHFREQGITNHQGSGGNFGSEGNEEFLRDYEDVLENADFVYNSMKSQGVANEMARMCIPVSKYTEFYMTVNLRNLLHFLTLRLHDHAQYEIRVYAKAMYDMLMIMDEFKWTMEVFSDMLPLEYLFQRANKKHTELLEVLTKFVEEHEL